MTPPPPPPVWNFSQNSSVLVGTSFPKGNNIMSQLVGSSVTDTEFHSVGISDDDDEDDPDIHDDDDDDDDNRPVRL